MQEKIEKIKQELANLEAENITELEKIRIYFLGKKGILTALFEELKLLQPEEKKYMASN